MDSLPSETEQQETQLPTSPRCSTSLFLMGGIRSTASNTVTNDEKPSSTTAFTQGKSLSRRVLPIHKQAEKTPPKFPNLSGSTSVSAHIERNTPSEQTQQQDSFSLLPPTSSSSSDEMDIAREAMRLTRETLHGSIGAVPTVRLSSPMLTSTLPHS